MTFSTFASPGVGLQGGGGSGGGGTASLPISGNGATVTASTPLINGTQTWDSGATTFTSLLLNVTDTASAPASLLMDLQVGGSSRFNVGKTGSLKLGVSPTGTNQAGTNVTIAGSQGTGTGAGGSIIFQVAPAGSSGTVQNALADALTINGDRTVQFASTIALGGSSGATLFKQAATNYIEAGTGFSVQAGTGAGVAMMNGLFNAGPQAYYGWNNVNGISTADLRLYRDAANTLALRNGTNAQTFNIYNTFTSSTNFERFRVVAQSAAAVLIGTEKGSGGGTARALALQTDGTTRLTIETNGDLTIADAENIILGTTTGTKIGTSTSQKIGFFNKAPVVQPTAVADATDNATAITQLNALLSRMRDLGLIAT